MEKGAYQAEGSHEPYGIRLLDKQGMGDWALEPRPPEAKGPNRPSTPTLIQRQAALPSHG